MNKRRLLKMAAFVETIPPEHFDMSVYRINRDGCGTVGCALGWAAQKKLFRGLRIARFGTAHHVFYHNASGATEIGADLFGIPDKHSERLFFEFTGHKTPTEVSANIRRYVETGELP